MATLFGVLFLGVLFLLPTALWVWCIVDIIRSEFSGNNKVIWLLIVILVPLLGMILYYVIGRGQRVTVSSTIGDDASPQQAKVSTKKIVLAIVLGVLLLGGGAVGIMAAIAIPQFSAYREKAYNAAALSDLKNARTAMESYYYDNKSYPDDLAKTGFKSSQDVDVQIALKQGKFAIVSSHNKGSKTYMMTSEENAIYQKGKDAPTSEFQKVP